MPAVRRRTWLIIVAALLFGTGGAAVWAAKEWPFARDSITRSLEQESGGKVVIGRFRETWFPPGFVANDVRVFNRQDPQQRPLIQARSLTLEATWHGLLVHHVQRIGVAGLHILIPPSENSPPFLDPSSSKTNVSAIGEVDIDGGLIEFLPHLGDTVPNVIKVNRIVLTHLTSGKIAAFRASFTTDKPPGQVSGEGEAGPMNISHPGATPVSGTYRLVNADLNVFNGLSGTLSSEGKFKGILSKIELDGSVDVPQFHVDGSSHSEHMTAKLRAAVDSHNADTTLEAVEARVGRTIVHATGDVRGGQITEGKTARLHMTIDTGRVEDLLNYFSDEKHPAMTGAVRLKADVELPPGPEFLKKITLTGDFGVGAGKFTNYRTQMPVNRLSESASGEKPQAEDPRTVLTNLTGHVAIKNGIASLRNVSFEFPGNYATLSGACQLIPMTLDIHGTLRTDGKLSDASTGFKALMLKVATPFLKKKSNVTLVPFAITGPASDPSFTLDLRNKTRL